MLEIEQFMLFIIIYTHRSQKARLSEGPLVITFYCTMDNADKSIN